MQIPYWGANVKIDGNLEDWKKVFSIIFEDTLSLLRSEAELEKFSSYPGKESFDLTKIKKPLSKNKVIVKTYWNYQNLYFAFIVYDGHLFAENSSEANEPKTFLNDGIEIYMDTRFDTEWRMDLNDYHLIVDVLNQYLVYRGDRKLMVSDTLMFPQDYGQNVLFTSAINVFGKINDIATKDSAYIVEMAIPFAAIGLNPQTGLKMKWDLCNNDVDYSVEGATSLTDSLLVYWPFNWVGLSDFGYPYTWRNIQLVGKPGLIEKLSTKYSQYWLLIFVISLTVSILIVSYLFIRVARLKKLPRIDEIPPAKVVLLKAQLPENTILSANQQILQRATDFIVQNKSQALRSEEVAKHLAISLRNLQRLTKEELHCSPTNFVYLVKLNLAAEFLANKQGNVTEAAYEFGFFDSSYFSKMFKKHFGIAPSEYRLNNSKNQ